MLAGNLAAIGVGGIVATLSSYLVRCFRLDIRHSALIFEQFPEDFDFEITRAINAPETRHVHAPSSTEADEDEKKSKEAIDAAEVENDDSDKELDPVGLQKAFRFAAWSSVALVGPLSYVGGVSSDALTLNVTSDVGNGNHHSTSLVLFFDGLRRGRIVRQVERLIRLRIFKLTLTRLFLSYSLGDCGDDLDVLLRVHSSVVSPLGIQGSHYSNCNRTCQGTLPSYSLG